MTKEEVDWVLMNLRRKRLKEKLLWEMERVLKIMGVPTQGFEVDWIWVEDTVTVRFFQDAWSHERSAIEVPVRYLWMSDEDIQEDIQSEPDVP